jgi:hypothetical protein
MSIVTLELFQIMVVANSRTQLCIVRVSEYVEGDCLECACRSIFCLFDWLILSLYNGTVSFADVGYLGMRWEYD